MNLGVGKVVLKQLVVHFRHISINMSGILTNQLNKAKMISTFQ